MCLLCSVHKQTTDRMYAIASFAPGTGSELPTQNTPVGAHVRKGRG